MPAQNGSVSDDRVARLDAYLESSDLEAVWFARPESFRWLTGGDNVVDRAAEVGVAAAGYDGDLRVVTDNIEAPRLAAEELPDGTPVETFPWHERSLAEAVTAVTPRPAAADFPAPKLGSLDPSTLRQPLSPADVETYRELGEETAAVVETICREATRETTEREVAAALRRSFADADIDVPVALVGSADRATEYRHYTPTDAALGAYALVSVTTRRNGLYASCTRTVAFDAPDWLEPRHERAARVEATALAATQRIGTDGGTAGDVFGSIRDAYDAVGHPDEWRNHHQGGAAGFAGREWIATPDAEEPVFLPMAYAWNPTIQGAKSEDTVLVTTEDFEVLTRTGDWPEQGVTSADGELTLKRPAVLQR